MANVFFNNQQHEIKFKPFICVKQIKSSFNVSIQIYVKRENRTLQKSQSKISVKI